MIYGFMEAEKARFPIRFMARRLEVSTSGFYEWRKRRISPSQRTIEDARLTETVRVIYERSRGTYGSPRVWAELRYGLGIRVGRKRVERLMRLAGISGITRRKGYRRRRVSGPIAADLVQRQFSPSCPDRLWLSDITQHPTREGTVYLAVVMDAWNREVIGWSITNHLRAEIVCDAFDMARWRRQPQPGSGLVCHSDHGSQYTSWAFGKKLRQAGILKSMGTIGDALDNAVVESFFATLQTELLDRYRWETRHQLSVAIFEYIEGWYNPERRHSYTNHQSPVNYRHQHELVA